LSKKKKIEIAQEKGNKNLEKIEINISSLNYLNKQNI
jgi:hypothetical protein